MNYFRGTPYEYDVLSTLRFVHSCGGQALELMPAHLNALDKQQLRDLKDLIGNWGVDLICGAGRTPQTDASSPDPQIREASYQASVSILTQLHWLGASKWDGLVHAAWPGHPKGVLTIEEKQAILQRSQQEMQRILPLADAYGIDLCFEVVNRFEHYLLNSAQEGIEFCKTLCHPRAKILLDIFHMNIEEDDMAASVAKAIQSGYLAHFHISEANRSVPGTVPTHIDWSAIFRSLTENGYSGSIILEPFINTGIPFTENSCIWRDLSGGADFNKMLEYVETGIGFTAQALNEAQKCI